MLPPKLKPFRPAFGIGTLLTPLEGIHAPLPFLNPMIGRFLQVAIQRVGWFIARLVYVARGQRFTSLAAELLLE
jgi:hypothetical protein